VKDLFAPLACAQSGHSIGPDYLTVSQLAKTAVGVEKVREGNVFLGVTIAAAEFFVQCLAITAVQTSIQTPGKTVLRKAA
jgi:hypothetical protein